MDSQSNKQFHFHPQVPPPPVPQQNWQWIQLLQEKDNKIKELKERLENTHNSIVQQDKYLDDYETKIDKLETDLKSCQEMLKTKDNEVKNSKEVLNNLELENKQLHIESKKTSINFEVQDKKKYEEIETLKRDIEKLNKENSNKEKKLKDLTEELSKLKSKSENPDKLIKNESNCLKSLDFRFTCDFCGYRFPNKFDLKNHMKSIHESLIQKKVIDQRLNIMRSIQNLQSNEFSRNTHNCKFQCKINHQRFNFKKEQSNIYMTELQNLASQNSYVINVNNVCNKTFFNHFASTQETSS